MAKVLKLDRQASYDARPLGASIYDRTDTPDGGAKITVGCKSSKSQRFFLRLPQIIKREFELDAFGMEVFDLCNGQRSVRHVIKTFSKTHELNPQEAQHAVTSFLQGMIKKGLIVMVVPNK